MTLTDAEIDAIRTSFFAVSRDSQRAGELFYDRLFERAPATRTLFVRDIAQQGRKLMNTLGLVVSQIQNLEDLVPVLEDLAQRHVAYGVQPQHYATVGAVLDDTFAAMMGETYSVGTRAAWLKAYGALAEAMIAHAYPIGDDAA